MKKLFTMTVSQKPVQVLREAVESLTVEIHKPQLDRESSEQPGLTLTLSLL